MKSKNLFLILISIIFLTSACGSSSSDPSGSDGNNDDSGNGTNWTGNNDSSTTDPQTATVSGTVTSSDPLADFSIGAEGNYHTYSFEGTSDGTVAISYEFTQNVGMICLYKTADVDTSSEIDKIDTVHCDISFSTSNTFSTTLTDTTSYSIAVLATFAHDTDPLEYTLTYTVSD